VLQCVAVCGSVLQPVERIQSQMKADDSAVSCVAVCCSVWQCVAVCCSLLSASNHI